MSYRLLVDLEAINVLVSSPGSLRVRLLDHIERLRVSPLRYVDYQDATPAGRRVEVSIFAGYSFHYWVDDAGEQVMVLDIRLADR